jgi:beta-propeller uncharacterized protein DUF5122
MQTLKLPMILFLIVATTLFSCQQEGYRLDPDFVLEDSVALNPVLKIKVLNDNSIALGGKCHVLLMTSTSTGGGCTELLATTYRYVPQKSRISGFAIIDSTGAINENFNPPFIKGISVQDFILLDSNVFLMRCDSLPDFGYRKENIYATYDINAKESKKMRFCSNKGNFEGKMKLVFVSDKSIICIINNEDYSPDTCLCSVRDFLPNESTREAFDSSIEYFYDDISFFRDSDHYLPKIISLEKGVPLDEIDSIKNENGSYIIEFNEGVKAHPAIFQGIKFVNNEYYAYGLITKYFDKKVSAGIIRLTEDGKLDSTFNTLNIGFKKHENPGYVRDICLQKDGKIICFGDFDSYNNQECPENIARLNPDGTLDKTFKVAHGFSEVDLLSVDVDEHNNIYIGGHRILDQQTIGRLILR